MALMKKDGGYYYADYRDSNGRRKRCSLQTKNKQIARLKYKEIMSRREAVREKICIHITWQAFTDKLFLYLENERSENTLRRTRIAIRHLERILKPHYLDDISPETLQRIKSRMVANGLGKHNVNRLIQCIKSFMHLAERWRLIQKQDWATVSKIKVPRGRVVFHSPEEINKILAVCPSEAWRIVVLLGCDAGLRRGEIAQLRWQDVDFANNQIYVAPNKTEYHRFVPMTQTLRKALEQAQTHAKQEYVVEVGREKSRTSKDFLTAYYKKIAQKAELPSFLHKLRHTFASQLVQNGVELYTVSKLLGHRSITMTEIYAHLAPPTLHKAIECVPKRQMPS